MIIIDSLYYALYCAGTIRNKRPHAHVRTWMALSLAMSFYITDILILASQLHKGTGAANFFLWTLIACFIASRVYFFYNDRNIRIVDAFNKRPRNPIKLFAVIGLLFYAGAFVLTIISSDYL
jgi:hypothetical protein